MKRYIIAAIAALATNVCIYAETHFLQVNFNNESEAMVEYAFNQSPEAVFSGSELVIMANEDSGAGKVEARYEMSDIKSLTIRTDMSGVEDVIDEVKSLRIYMTSTDLTITGLGFGSELSIYDTAGRLATRVSADSDGRAVVSIASLDNGVYIATTPQHSFKFIKK